MMLARCVVTMEITMSVRGSGSDLFGLEHRCNVGVPHASASSPVFDPLKQVHRCLHVLLKHVCKIHRKCHV